MIRAAVQFARAVASATLNRAVSSVVFNRAVISAVQLGKFIKFFVASLSDSFAVSDDHSLSPTKFLSHNAQTEDQRSLATGKPESDSGLALEAAIIEAAKVFEQQSNLTDGERRAVEKALQDSPEITETQAFAIVKAISDIARVTDDVDGEADVNDDQDINFFKITADIAFATESINLTAEFVRAFADLGVFSDNDVLFIGKGLADESFIDDAQSFAVAVYRSDAGLVSESASLGLSRALTDVSGVSESLFKSMAFARFLTDSGTAEENLAVAVDKVFGDSAGVSEVIELFLILPIFFADSAGIQDDEVLAIEAVKADQMQVAEQTTKDIISRLVDGSSVSDIPSLRYGTAFDDISDFIDDQVKSTDKSVLDAGLIDDAGSLRSQGYCDFSYFAEDYVGESRTFT